MDQPRKLSPAALAAVLLVIATAATAPAAPLKPLSAEESAETRFVLFALEDLINTTWPDPQSVGSGRAVKTFIAQRERIVDDLSHRVRDAKLGGDRNAELIEALELYMKSVKEHGQKYVAALDKIIDVDGAAKKWCELYKQVNKEAEPARYVVAAQVNSAALDHMRRGEDNPFGMFATIFLGLMAESRIQLAVQQETWQRLKNAHLKQAKERYDREQPALAKALSDSMHSDLERRKDAARELAAALGGPRKWPENDLPFARGKSEGTSDPFTLMRRIYAEKVETERGPTHEAGEHLAKAKRYLKLIPLVPKRADNAFNYYRSVIYGQAGLEANKAAKLSVGANGFSTRKGSEGSRLAIDVWAKYLANSDRDVTPEVLHNYALALVYNGAAVQAYDTLKKASSQFLPQSAEFHYELSRLCSVAAEDTAVAFAAAATTPEFMKLNKLTQDGRKAEVQRRVNGMLQDSSLCLQRAVCCGFKDVEKARESPDLKTLREADARVLGHRRTFEQIVGDQKTFANVIENIVAGK